MSDTYISLTNWDKYQHYKDRNPGWIKLHISLVSSEGWVKGDAEQKNLIIALMVAAARFNNRIPAHADMLHRCCVTAASLTHDRRTIAAYAQRIRKLESCGFIEIHGKMLAQRREENINLEEKKEPLCSNSENPSSNEVISESLFQSEATPKPTPPGVGASSTSKAKATPKPSHEAEKLAQFLLTEIQKNRSQFPTKQAQLRQWADTADKMLRIDRRTCDDAADLIRWVQRDEFERKNVLSMDKLRKRYDQLAMKRDDKPKPKLTKADQDYQNYKAKLLASEVTQ
jgi:hypothetical protein